MERSQNVHENGQPRDVTRLATGVARYRYNDREIIREVTPGKVYVDRESGEEFRVVGKVLPLAPSASNLPWAVENLRLCGCSLEQLAPKDVNDCPHCGRRLPAFRGE